MQRVGQLRLGVAKIVEDARFSPAPDAKYMVADLITGWGVAESVLSLLPPSTAARWPASASSCRAGATSVPPRYYLAQAGARVVGIIDRDGGIC